LAKRLKSFGSELLFFASISLFLFTKEREPWQALVWIGQNCTILHSTLRFRSWFCRTNGRFGCSS